MAGRDPRTALWVTSPRGNCARVGGLRLHLGALPPLAVPLLRVFPHVICQSLVQMSLLRRGLVTTQAGVATVALSPHSTDPAFLPLLTCVPQVNYRPREHPPALVARCLVSARSIVSVESSRSSPSSSPVTHAMRVCVFLQFAFCQGWEVTRVCSPAGKCLAQDSLYTSQRGGARGEGDSEGRKDPPFLNAGRGLPFTPLPHLPGADSELLTAGGPAGQRLAASSGASDLSNKYAL